MCSIILQIIAIVYFIFGVTHKNIQSHIFTACSFAIIGGINVYNNLWILGVFFIILSLVGLSLSLSFKEKIVVNGDKTDDKR